MANGNDRKIRIERPADCNFDERKAQRGIDFFSNHLHHTKGKWAGQPFIPEPFQAVDIREIYGRVDEDGNRLIRQVFKAIPKKNGKSEEAAGHALKLTFADDEPGAEVYGAASDREQAGIVFNVAASMVRRDPALMEMCEGRVFDSRKRIVVPSWESFYQAVSSEVAGKHGYNSHGVVFDEVHAQRDMFLWEVLTFGAGDARAQPLTFAITTAGIIGESPVAEMLWDDADQILRGIVPCPVDFYPVIYAAPDEAPWDNEEVWRLCNPALGNFLSLDAVRKQCEQAKRRPSEQNSFKRLRLNQWVGQEVRAIDMRLWDYPDCRQPIDLGSLRELPCSIGVDLSSKLDLTCINVVWLDTNGVIYFLPFFFIPADNLQDRPNLEAHKYRQWIEQEKLTATPGSAVNFDHLRHFIRDVLQEEMGLNIADVALDPMFAEQLRQQLESDGFTVCEFRQTFRYYTEPWNFLEAALAEHRVRHAGHPVLRWNADCLAIKQDVDGRTRPVKPDRLKSKKRIDGQVAGLMGLGRRILQQPQAEAGFIAV